MTTESEPLSRLGHRLPLVIGVTGHRDIREKDLPRLKQLASEVMARVKADYLRGDQETPLIILSALAEGADQLVAQVAIEHGAYLVAPLPMPLQDYRRDFDPGLKPGALAKFEELLARSVTSPAIASPTEAVEHDEQYRQAGIFIVRHCHVLIALWDGDENNMAAGGTAEIVKFKRDGIPLDLCGSARLGLDSSLKGPIIHIVTPRESSSNKSLGIEVRPWGRDVTKSSIGATVSVQESDRLSWEVFDANLGLTRRFNRDASALANSSRGAALMEKNLLGLFDDPVTRACNEEAKRDALARAPLWCFHYKLTDTLAQRLQWRFKKDWYELFASGFAAFLVFEIFSHLHHAWYALAFYGLFSSILFGLFIFARIRQHQERYLDYRALAEALRVGLFLKLLGLTGRTELPESASGNATPISEIYPNGQQSELAWIKVCLRSLELLETIKPVPAGNSEPDLNWLRWARTIWIDGQRRFFERQGARHERRAKVSEITSLLVFGASPLLVLVWLLTAFHGQTLDGFLSSEWTERPGLIFIIGLLPGVAAVIAGLPERLAYQAQARQYDKMGALYNQAYELLDPKSSGSNARALVASIYAEIGNEAMRENADWVSIFRQRPIRPPQG